MISVKAGSEYCLIQSFSASITLVLLPKTPPHILAFAAHSRLQNLTMAELLHKAIGAMSIEEEEPLVLPDSPQFTVVDANETSLLGRLLNPDCQIMARMIDYMPTAWRVYGRVRGIALSRDRFQFIFQREEDLLTVLKDRPWSYNRWAMVLERWTASPPTDFLSKMEIWIRIRNIPANHFTSDTMYRLASEVGKVEVIAYDPKVSHTKEYIRALVTFDVDNPAKASRKLSTKNGMVNIEFEYEKIHKRCHHCLRLTHEKPKCPYRKAVVQAKSTETSVPVKARSHDMERVPPRAQTLLIEGPSSQNVVLEGPPGFPPLFPELSKEEQKMAMLYISHSDATERLARIQRVKQGIADNAKESSLRLIRITNELDKGKGHVFHYPDNPVIPHDREGSSRLLLKDAASGEEEAESSATLPTFFSAPTNISTGFQLGPSSEGRVSGKLNVGRTQRKRPSSWKRRSTPAPQKALAPIPAVEPSVPAVSSSKRKQNSSASFSDNKAPKHTDSSVASVLKPLLPQ